MTRRRNTASSSEPAAQGDHRSAWWTRSTHVAILGTVVAIVVLFVVIEALTNENASPPVHNSQDVNVATVDRTAEAFGDVEDVEVLDPNGNALYHDVIVPGSVVELTCREVGDAPLITHTSFLLGDVIPHPKTLQSGTKYSWAVPSNLFQRAVSLEVSTYRGNVTQRNARGFSVSYYAIEPEFRVLNGVGLTVRNIFPARQAVLTLSTRGLADLPFLQREEAGWVMEYDTSPDFASAKSLVVTETQDDADFSQRTVAFVAPAEPASELYWRYRTTRLRGLNYDHELVRVSPYPFAVVEPLSTGSSGGSASGGGTAGGGGGQEGTGSGGTDDPTNVLTVEMAKTSLVLREGGTYNMDSAFRVLVSVPPTSNFTDVSQVDSVDVSFTVAGMAPQTQSVEILDLSFEDFFVTLHTRPFYDIVPWVGPRSVSGITFTLTFDGATGLGSVAGVSFSLVPWLSIPHLTFQNFVLYKSSILGQMDVWANTVVPGVKLCPTLGWTGTSELVEDLQLQVSTDPNTASTYLSSPLPLFQDQTHSEFRLRNLALSDFGVTEEGKNFTVKKSTRTVLTGVYVFLRAQVTVQGVTETLVARMPFQVNLTCGCRRPFMAPLVALPNGSRSLPNYFAQPGTGTTSFNVTLPDSCVGDGPLRSDVPTLMARGVVDKDTMLVFVTRGVGAEAQYYYLWWYYSDTSWERGEALVMRRYAFLEPTNTLYVMLWVNGGNSITDTAYPVVPLRIDQPYNAPYAYLDDVGNDTCSDNTVNTLIAHRCRRNRNYSGYSYYMRQEQRPVGVPRRCRVPTQNFQDPYTFWSCDLLRMADVANGVPARANCLVPQ